MWSWELALGRRGGVFLARRARERERERARAGCRERVDGSFSPTGGCAMGRATQEETQTVGRTTTEASGRSQVGKSRAGYQARSLTHSHRTHARRSTERQGRRSFAFDFDSGSSRLVLVAWWWSGFRDFGRPAHFHGRKEKARGEKERGGERGLRGPRREGNDAPLPRFLVARTPPSLFFAVPQATT